MKRRKFLKMMGVAAVAPMIPLKLLYQKNKPSPPSFTDGALTGYAISLRQRRASKVMQQMIDLKMQHFRDSMQRSLDESFFTLSLFGE